MAALEVGHRVLIDDGKMVVVVRETSEPKGEWVKTEVMNDAMLSSRKGFNLPDTFVPGSALTEKDKKDLAFCLENIDFDWVALSFVQEAGDIMQLRELMGDHPGKVVAKIEKPSAIDNIRAITDVCDGIMVARGDLGVEMLPEDVPMLQKLIVDEARLQGKPVIVATQMLESMMDNPAPTRAECSDIATAIYDGADAVMLSGESAAGKYPVESVAMQQRVISRVENDPMWRSRSMPPALPSDGTFSDALMKSACNLAKTMNAKCMVVLSDSGASVMRCSRERPDVPILALTPHAGVARYLNLQKNVYAAVMDPKDMKDDSVFEKAIEIARQRVLVESNEDIVIATAGVPYGTPGAANVIRVLSGDAGKPPAFTKIADR
jgi:pyruvate kinase